jgi:hypothetical protein
MLLRAVFSALVVFAILIGISEGRAQAQLFPDDKMAAAFWRNIDSIALNNGGAFVSRCHGPKAGELAILVVPLGTHRGTLSLWDSGKVYNGAGLEIKEGKAFCD